MDNNRVEVLRCLLVMFSGSLYQAPDDTMPFSGRYVNKWLDIVACNTSFHSLALFNSLLNSLCTYDPIGMPAVLILISMLTLSSFGRDSYAKILP